jgi:hypothetical protein
MVLSDRSIKEALAARQIVIEPLNERDIQPASVDLHLDKPILVFRNSSKPYIDVREDLSDLTGRQAIYPTSGRVRAWRHDGAHRTAERHRGTTGGQEFAWTYRPRYPLDCRVHRSGMEGQSDP